MKRIESTQNATYKRWLKLQTSRGRKKQGQYLIEGSHLVEEACLSGQPIQQLIIADHFVQQADHQPLIQAWQAQATEVFQIPDSLGRGLGQTEASQGIFAVLDLPSTTLDWLPAGNRLLIVDAVQDPGNLGTLIRTADAAGYDGVILGEGTVDLYNDKVLRATQGSLWHLPVLQADLKQAIPQLQAQGIKVLVTALNQAAVDYRQVDPSSPLALILGNEGAGVAPVWIQLADQAIYIPMPGRAESLNVGVAGGILMFHFV